MPNPFDASPVGSLSVDVADGAFYVRRSGTVSIDVTLTRGPGTQGDVVVSVESPPQGVTFDPLTITADATTGTLLAHAMSTAPYSRTTLTVDGVAGMTSVTDTLDLVVIGNVGDLDTSFGGGGQVTLIGVGLAGVFAQGANTVVVLTATQTGDQGVLATRLFPNGGVDSTFGDSGTSFVDLTTIGLSGGVQSVAAMQSTGNIVVSGSGSNGMNRDPFVVRLSTDGQVDAALQPRRIDTSTNDDAINAIAVGFQDQIFVGGTTGPSSNRDALVMRLTSAGQLDPSFAAGRLTFGSATNDVLGALVGQTDGGIVVEWGSCPFACGSALRRYKSNGTEDTGFGVGGDLTPKENYGLATVTGLGLPTQTDFFAWGTGSGSQNPSFAVWRYLQSGTPDTQFGSGGLYEAAGGQRSMTIADTVSLPDGSVLAVGWDQSPTVGSLDYYLTGLELSAAGVPSPNVGTSGFFRDSSIVFVPQYVAVRPDHRFAVLGIVTPATAGQAAVRTYFW